MPWPMARTFSSQRPRCVNSDKNDGPPAHRPPQGPNDMVDLCINRGRSRTQQEHSPISQLGIHPRQRRAHLRHQMREISVRFFQALGPALAKIEPPACRSGRQVGDGLYRRHMDHICPRRQGHTAVAAHRYGCRSDRPKNWLAGHDTFHPAVPQNLWCDICCLAQETERLPADAGRFPFCM